MATFRVRLMGPITEIVGKNLLDVEAQEGATLSDVFTEVGRQCGEGVRKKILAPDGDFHPWVLVSVNGADIKGLEGINTRLKDGDGVLVALAIVGG